MSFLSSPYMSSFVGFESLFDEIERMSSMKQSTYPAYDIKKLSNNRALQYAYSRGYVREALSHILEIPALEIPLDSPPGLPGPPSF